MHRVELKHLSIQPRGPLADWPRILHLTLSAAFIAGLCLSWAGASAWSGWLGRGNRPEALLVFLATATTLASLARYLPAQNVLLAAAGIGLSGAMAHTLNAVTAIPFGPLRFNQQRVGPCLFELLPWFVPFLWIIVVLNSRGVARLILRSQRGKPAYGLWVIGLTVLLVAILELCLQPYGIKVKGYWWWRPTRIPSDWYTAPWSDFLGWLVSSLVCLLFVTPALINKHPGHPPPPPYHPLLVWEVLSALLLLSLWKNRLLAATGITLGQMLVVAVLSLPRERQKIPRHKAE